MKFIHNDLGSLNGSEIVVVTLTAAANVKLMDSSNFLAYRAGRRHEYFGGYARHSPTRLSVPHSGHWHVAIDLGGYAGSVKASVSVLN